MPAFVPTKKRKKNFKQPYMVLGLKKKKKKNHFQNVLLARVKDLISQVLKITEEWKKARPEWVSDIPHFLLFSPLERY